MFHFTKQERLILWVLLAVLFVGSVLNYLFKKNPQIEELVSFLDSDRFADRKKR